MKKITVLGAGSWGTALAQVLTDNQHQVLLYTNNKEQAEEINSKHTNELYAPNVTLSTDIKCTVDLEEAVNFSDIILLVLPSKVQRMVLHEVNKLIDSPKVFVNASKGIEPVTHKRLSEITFEEINEDFIKGYVALIGPSHAEEVIIRMVTSIVSVSLNDDVALEVQELFSNDYFRVYRSNDLLGAELGSSVKNVIALASGIISGMGLGDNTRAALVTRGLSEIVRFGIAMGAQPETFYGLTGVGDLIVTATSKHSRNFQAGFKVGSGMKASDALEQSFMVVEGVRTAEAVYDLIEELGIEMPITEAVYRVFYKDEDPKIALRGLMGREIKAEN
jgi:glycerol-3-phosphate dehydrogenase (NAD(P)+)